VVATPELDRELERRWLNTGSVPGSPRTSGSVSEFGRLAEEHRRRR
jgi:hypothetical protein